MLSNFGLIKKTENGAMDRKKQQPLWSWLTCHDIYGHADSVDIRVVNPAIEGVCADWIEDVSKLTKKKWWVACGDGAEVI